MQVSHRLARSRSPGFERLVLCAVLLLGVPAAAMACTISSGSRVRFDAIDTGRDTAVGAALGPVQTMQTTVNCNANPGPTSARSGYELRLYPTLPLSTTLQDVWQTTTPGVGIRVINITENMPLSTSAGGSYSLFAPILGQTARSRQNYTFTFQLIKTGPINPTTSQTGRVAQTQLYDLYSYNRRTGVRSRREDQVSMDAVNFTIRSCTAAGDMTVPVWPNPVRQSDLIINGTAGTALFHLFISCPNISVRAFVTITDHTNPGNRSDILSLSPQSTARGVGLRIRRRGNYPVFLGPDSAEVGNENQWPWSELEHPVSGQAAHPLSVELVRTGRVQAGTVHAVATYTLSYQ